MSETFRSQAAGAGLTTAQIEAVCAARHWSGDEALTAEDYAAVLAETPPPPADEAPPARRARRKKPSA